MKSVAVFPLRRQPITSCTGNDSRPKCIPAASAASATSRRSFTKTSDRGRSASPSVEGLRLRHPDSRTSNCNELSSQHFLLADLHPIHARSNSCFDLRQYVRARFSESQ